MLAKKQIPRQNRALGNEHMLMDPKNGAGAPASPRRAMADAEQPMEQPMALAPRCVSRSTCHAARARAASTRGSRSSSSQSHAGRRRSPRGRLHAGGTIACVRSTVDPQRTATVDLEKHGERVSGQKIPEILLRTYNVSKTLSSRLVQPN